MIKEVLPTDPEIKKLINELSELNGKLYPLESTFQDSPEKMLSQKVYMLGFFVDNKPVGIGAIKPCGEYFEIKRMYVQPDFQGKGISVQILSKLEEHARKNNISLCKLETGIKQLPAINFYKKMGYLECEPFGEYAKNDFNLYFEKKININSAV